MTSNYRIMFDISKASAVTQREVFLWLKTQKRLKKAGIKVSFERKIYSL